MDEQQQLSKKERRRLRKQEARGERERGEKSGPAVKIIFLVVFLGLVSFGLYRWIKGASEVESVGEELEDLGAQHVTDISGVIYNSNPPTSGTHFPVWAKPGVYQVVISDGHLVHSLEHGYVVISYNCDKLKITNNQFSIFKKAVAHEGEEENIPEGLPHPNEATGSAEPLMQMRVGLEGRMSFFDTDNPPEKEVELPESFSSKGCEKLEVQLKKFFGENKNKRLIVVPRPSLDTQVALTAWTRILEMDEWDEEQALVFLNAWDNRGPEQTVE